MLPPEAHVPANIRAAGQGEREETQQRHPGKIRRPTLAQKAIHDSPPRITIRPAPLLSIKPPPMGARYTTNGGMCKLDFAPSRTTLPLG
jgi:hypothetical protein